MAFVSVVSDNDEFFASKTLQNESELIARAEIGYDDVTGAVYSVVVALTQDILVPNGRDVSFDVVESLPDEPDNWCNDGTQTKRFLVGDHRKTALSCICVMAQELVNMSKDVELFTMMTVSVGLPEKALVKYDLICGALREMGLLGGRDSPYHGSQIWIMQRSP